MNCFSFYFCINNCLNKEIMKDELFFRVTNLTIFTSKQLKFFWSKIIFWKSSP